MLSPNPAILLISGEDPVRGHSADGKKTTGPGLCNNKDRGVQGRPGQEELFDRLDTDIRGGNAWYIVQCCVQEGRHLDGWIQVGDQPRKEVELGVLMNW